MFKTRTHASSAQYEISVLFSVGTRGTRHALRDSKELVSDISLLFAVVFMDVSGRR